MPKGRQVVHGLVTTKRGALEQLCLSPQSGFSSTVEGNVLTLDDDIDKPRLVVDVAQDVWG